jgi:hypothetical protein
MYYICYKDKDKNYQNKQTKKNTIIHNREQIRSHKQSTTININRQIKTTIKNYSQPQEFFLNNLQQNKLCILCICKRKISSNIQ